MSGIYIHIPFCKQKCTYCDFYTIVAPGLINETINSIIKEIEIQKDYLSDKNIQTIYFGGGTPSILNQNHLKMIFEKINENFKVDKNAEITLEANPDDLTDEFFIFIKQSPVNRLSIGIQSFNDKDLQQINRRHSATQAIESVKRAQKYGFNNISIDLIYGLPEQDIEGWKENIQTAIDLNVQHISAYGLTYEQGTVLWRQRQKGIVHEKEDDDMNQMFEILRKKLINAGFVAYEISNYCIPGFRSRHNSAYWRMLPYLGLGPSAHSYNGVSRQWNVSSVKKYNEAIQNSGEFFEIELLSDIDKYNEIVMVSLRTIDGFDAENIDKQFKDHFLKSIEGFINSGHVYQVGKKYILTENGFKISDYIISKLMIV